MYRFIASDLLVSGFQNNLDINENASISSTTIIGLALVRAFKENLSLIDSLRENGEIVNESSTFVSIKAYSGGNPNKNKEKHSEDITH